MTPVEVLKAARAKIEQGWTRGAYARDAKERDVAWGSPSAVCFCARGAIRSIGGFSGPADDAMRRLGTATGAGGWIADWNDEPGRTQAEVLAAFDKAIALAEAQQS